VRENVDGMEMESVVVREIVIVVGRERVIDDGMEKVIDDGTEMVIASGEAGKHVDHWELPVLRAQIGSDHGSSVRW